MNRIAILVVLIVPAAARAADWPQFLGPTRDGHSAETGLLHEWPKDGPPKAWECEVGPGYSGPAIAGGKLILFHRIDDAEVVECLDAKTGKKQWKHSNPTGYVDDLGKGDGPRATPVIAGDRVYTLGAEGRLLCLEFASGKKVWERDLATDYPFRKGYFGVASSPLVDGDRLFINVGSKGAGVVAFDRNTGKEVWKASNHRASYATPTIAKIDGKRVLLFLTREGLLVLDPKDGSEVYSRPFRARIDASVNAATPLVAGDEVFLSASYNTGALLLDGRGWKEIWKSDDALSNHYNTSVKVGDYLYGIHGREEAGGELRCVEWKTGKVAWTKEGFGCAFLIAADGMLIAAVESGELVLLEATPKAYTERGRFAALDKPRHAVAAPALSDGLLFVRNDNKLAAWRVKKD